MKIAYHPSYVLQLPTGHKFPMEKYKVLANSLSNKKQFSENFIKPEPVSFSQASFIHNKDYLNKLINLELTDREIRRCGFPLSEKLVEREFLVAGGTLDAAKYATDEQYAFNIAGGTHHAFSDHGEAFCLLNDTAIASLYLLNYCSYKKILIIDLDVHQRNGTAKILRYHQDIFTFSMHGKHNYPFKKETSDLDIELDDQTVGKIYFNFLIDSLEKISQIFKADFIFYNAGVDVLNSDQLGKLSLSLEECKKRDQIVFNYAKIKNVPIVTVMGGGYSKDLNLIIAAHLNTYDAALEIFG